MGPSVLLLSTLLLSHLPAPSLRASAEHACLCTESPSSEPCGPERTTCHCADSTGWTRVRFWAEETSRCEELVFYLLDGEPGQTRPQ
ncbi:MAG: hypothetical protein ACREBE_01660 [bacterium]